MIPLRLTLKNFLSYRDATLNFQGLHTACICGSNGSGKSSLLEAITWVLWGQSRAAVEDDAIHAGASEARVDFIFQCNQQTYRTIRTRQRGGGAALEFQVAVSFGENGEPSNFRSLTEKGVRATQQLILHHLKLDYDTFINSAYLRQGRADEFMLKRPNERKQILADLLKLEQYETLAEQAKDLSRQFKGQAEQLGQNLQGMQAQLQEREAIAFQQTSLQAELQQLQQAQKEDGDRLQILQVTQHQRQTWEQQLTWQRQQHQNLTQDGDRLQQDLAIIQQQQQQLAQLLAQEAEITAGCHHYQQLQGEEESLSQKLQLHQDAQEQRQQLQSQLAQEVNELNLQLKQVQGQVDALSDSRQDIQQILSRADEVEVALKQLTAARARLQHLDNLQLQVSPLLQRRQSLQTELDRTRARLGARLEELQSTINQLEVQRQRFPKLQQAVMEVAEHLEQLEKKRVRQQRVQEKGLERRSFRDRLQENQREYEAKLGELTQKLQMLSKGTEESGNQGNVDKFPPCPLCDRPLDEHHWYRVIAKTEDQQKELQELFWVVREQLTTCESELQVLRQEYAQLTKELAPYDQLREQRGQLAAQIEATNEAQIRLQQIATETAQLERSLASSDFDVHQQLELQRLEQQLKELNYDEKNHALARGEADRWRWAEIKQAEIKNAQQRQAQIDAQIPDLLAKIAKLKGQIEQLQTNSELAREVAEITSQIAEVNYDRSYHDRVKISLRQAQFWQLRYQELAQAQQQYPQLKQREQELTQGIQIKQQDLQLMAGQIAEIIKQLAQLPDTQQEIQLLDQKMQQRRKQMDDCLGQLGRWQQQQQFLETLKNSAVDTEKQLQTAKRQYRVYQELSQAFGKNGIQALTIENILPQLEAQTNSLLSRLSSNQLHVQFITQKAGRGGKSSAKKTTKLIDTLDILIADAQGTRPYETYSGGEAFRINFAIRLALARMLAQRAGTALQILIIDEGFGTQDQEGCDRLVAAINAIASDFSCILTVTHMPYFKEAFQARVEVRKTQDGSQLSLSM